MEAIVLAGGFGTRLREVITDLPKPMAPIAGRPFLEILLSMLSRKGIKRVVLALGYMSEKIINHFNYSYQGMEIVYTVEEQPLGTGGAIRAALEYCLSDHVFIFNGDTYLDLEVEALELQWQKTQNPIIVVREVANTARYGRIDIKEGRIHGFLEKGMAGCGLINAGCYVLPPQILDHFPLGKAFSLENDFFVKQLQQINFNSFITQGQFIDIGIPSDYELAQTQLAGL